MSPDEIAKIETYLKERYVLISKAVLTAILVTAGLSTVVGAWGAAKAAIESSAAKKATEEIIALRNAVATLHNESKADKDKIAALLADAMQGKIGDVDIAGNLNVSGRVSIKEAEIGKSLLVGVGGAGLYIQHDDQDTTSLAIGWGGAKNSDKQKRYDRLPFFARVKVDGSKPENVGFSESK
jgi:hypothetical protein